MSKWIIILATICYRKCSFKKCNCNFASNYFFHRHDWKEKICTGPDIFLLPAPVKGSSPPKASPSTPTQLRCLRCLPLSSLVAAAASALLERTHRCKCQKTFWPEVFLLKIIQKSLGHILFLSGFYLKTFWSIFNRWKWRNFILKIASWRYVFISWSMVSLFTFLSQKKNELPLKKLSFE